MAVLGSNFCARMAERVFVDKQELNERAIRMGDWAIGALDQAPNEDAAFHILDLSLLPESVHKQFSPRQTLLDLAMFAGYKPLLATSHAQKLTDVWWRGGDSSTPCVLPAKFSWLLLSIHFFLPFLNPALDGNVIDVCFPQWRGRLGRDARKKEEEVEPPSSVAGLAFSMQVAMREWRKARVSLEEMGHDMKEQTKQVAANPVGAVANGVANGVGSCVHGVHEVTTEVGKGIQHRVAQMSRDIEVFKSQRLEPDVTRRKRKAARERGERASLSRFYRTPAVKFLFRFFAFVLPEY